MTVAPRVSPEQRGGIVGQDPGVPSAATPTPVKQNSPSGKNERAPWSGVFVSLGTPFQDDEHLDVKSLESMVEFSIESGVSGLVVNSAQGEAFKLSTGERRLAAEAVLARAKGRIPVLVGVSGASNHGCVELARHAKEHGASGIMAAPPPGAAFTESQVQIFFDELDAAVGLPLMVQDAPHVVPIHLSPQVVANLFPEIGSVTAVKVEAPPTATKISAILRLEPALTIFGGLEGAFVVDELSRGARGVMCGPVLAGPMQQIMSAFQSGDPEGARRAHSRIAELIRFMSQSMEFGFHCSKRLLKVLGVIECTAVRRPTCPFDERNERDLLRISSEVGLLPKIPR